MSIWKASLVALLIPATLAEPAMAQGEGRHGPRFIFEELDANGDGGVTLEELESAGEARFAEADADGNGSLSREELIAQGEARIERGVDRMLERADADGDGALTQEEIADARQGRRGPDPARMFSRMDADNDGTVTEAEFDDAISRLIERRGFGHRDRG